jgi:hypothetical protein
MGTVDLSPNAREDEYEQIFKFRSGEERSITTIRITDILRVHKRANLSRFYGWSKVPTLNFLCYELACPDLTYIVDLVTMFPEDVALEIAKELSLWTKNSGYNVVDPRVVELHTLFGYMVYGDFDFRKAALALAQADPPRHVLGDYELHQYIPHLFKELKADRPPKPLSFREYILTGQWIKAGSASVGYEEADVNGESVKIKVRKNLIPFIYSVDELLEMATTAPFEEINRAFVKPELAKKRIAVAGSLGSYLRWSYLLYCSGAFYAAPPTTVVDVNALQHLAVIWVIQALLKQPGMYGSSVDIDAYDNNIRDSETQAMSEVIFDKALGNVNHEDVIKVTEMCRVSIRNSKLLITPPEDRRVTTEWVKVPHTVQSGIRPTSPFGNMISTTIALILMALYNVVCFTTGDDILIIGLKEEVLKATAAVQGMQFPVSPTKFGIVANSGEFLRVAYSPGKASGYLPRALAGLSQRKPWNNDPPYLDYILERQLKVIDTLERRGGLRAELERVVLLAWSKRAKTSYLWAILPKPLGGLGYGRWGGKIPLSRVERNQKPSIEAKLVHENRQLANQIVATKLEEFEVTLSEAEAQEFTQKQLPQILLGDGIPAVVGAYRANERRQKYPSTQWRLVALQGFEHLASRPYQIDIPYAMTKQELARLALAKEFPIHRRQLVTAFMLEKISGAKRRLPEDSEYLTSVAIPGIESRTHPLLVGKLSEYIWSLLLMCFGQMSLIQLCVSTLYAADLLRSSQLYSVELAF